MSVSEDFGENEEVDLSGTVLVPSNSPQVDLTDILDEDYWKDFQATERDLNAEDGGTVEMLAKIASNAADQSRDWFQGRLKRVLPGQAEDAEGTGVREQPAETD